MALLFSFSQCQCYTSDGVWTIWCHSTGLCAKPKVDDGQEQLLNEHSLFCKLDKA